MVYIVSTTVFWLHGYAKTTNTAPVFDIFTLQTHKNMLQNIFFLQIIWSYQKYVVPLHRVFHGIRFKVK